MWVRLKAGFLAFVCAAESIINFKKIILLGF
jgi:hypothetical protein